MYHMLNIPYYKSYTFHFIMAATFLDILIVADITYGSLTAIILGIHLSHPCWWMSSKLFMSCMFVLYNLVIYRNLDIYGENYVDVGSYILNIILRLSVGIIAVGIPLFYYTSERCREVSWARSCV